MSLEDRHWRKEDFDRRMGCNNSKMEQGSADTDPKPKAKKADAEPNMN